MFMSFSHLLKQPGVGFRVRTKYTGDLMKDAGWDKLMCQAVRKREPKMKKLKEDRLEGKYLELDEGAEKDIGRLDPTPESMRTTRKAIIKRRPKMVTQQGTGNANHWELYFETKERWENPTMGWSSTGDPLSNFRLKFDSRDTAVEFARSRGWSYEVDDESAGKRGKFKPSQDYKINFHWCKRTRVSTK